MGIQGTDQSARFKETFEDVYKGGKLDTLPYYVVAGNHDYYGNVTAQVAYAKRNPQWMFSELYYTKHFSVNGFTVDIVFIDTVPLAGNSDLQEDPFAPLPGPAPEDVPIAETQWAWIEEQFKTSTADYLLCVGHYPVYSGCSHGDTPALKSHLKPLLEQHHVQAYISGHEHCAGMDLVFWG